MSLVFVISSWLITSKLLEYFFALKFICLAGVLEPDKYNYVLGLELCNAKNVI